jgi:hypothetical protein
VAERCVNWLKGSRALAARFDELTVNCLTAVKLATLQRYLRVFAPIESSDRP